MVALSDQVYGRTPVIGLVREHMSRGGVDGPLRNQHFPILVIEGSRGAGKTALMSALKELLDQRVPFATLDFEEASSSATVPQVLSALALGLMKKCPRYGVLQFPRLTVGQLAIEQELKRTLTAHKLDRRKVEEELERLRGIGAFREVLAKTAGAVLDAVNKGSGGLAQPSGDVVEIVLKWLTTRAPQRIVHGPALGWYGDQDLGLTHDPLDVLVQLNQYASDYQHEAYRQQVNLLLLAAFLADLRAEFDRGRRADERSLNCVVLLDNADTELGQSFLHELVRVRRQRGPGGQYSADPLTVVATSRGTLLAGVADADLELVTPDNHPDEPDARSTSRPRAWWRPYRLPDLTEDEVGQAVAVQMLRQVTRLVQVQDQHVTRVVFQLTGGHPASTRLMLDALHSTPSLKLIEPDVVLGRKQSGTGSHRSQPVEDQMLTRLLGSVSEAMTRDLETCAAARDKQHALMLSAQKDLVVGGYEYSTILEPILWPADRTAGPALLRRLLRRRLARRTATDLPSWSKVYNRLRYVCRPKGGKKGDEEGELYYALAEGDLGFVTERLHQRIIESPGNTGAMDHAGHPEHTDAQWLQLLKSVIAAPRPPRRRPDGDHGSAGRIEHLTDGAGEDELSPQEEARMLARGTELNKSSAPLARLIAALHVAADPFIGSDRSDLHYQIAADYNEVARLTPDGPSAVLLEEARRHLQEADWWR